jgi:hypothetical protein
MIQAEVLPAPEREPCVDETSKWEQERSAYWRLLPTLASQYRGQCVATLRCEGTAGEQNMHVRVPVQEYWERSRPRRLTYAVDARTTGDVQRPLNGLSSCPSRSFVPDGLGQVWQRNS